jgi:hypothetical protein
MSAEYKEIFIGPDEGASLPTLDIVHKSRPGASPAALP